jgi:UDP-N-acetylmuramoyl-L-alanyl-D-glutamate--2,6-diaminopimelate ligase
LLLSELVRGLPGVRSVQGDADVKRVSIDSRNVATGDLFVCLPGEKADSHEYIAQALAAGAIGAVVSDGRFATGPGARVLVDDATDSCWRICKRLYGDPSRAMKVIGVTGTNGKTTVAWLLAQALNSLGVKAGYVGTLGAWIGGELKPTNHTTAFSPELNETLRRAVGAGHEALVLEVSSHALSQRRVDGIEFDVGVFTNLSQDHLDYHKDLDDYFKSKLRLFKGLPTSKRLRAVVNADDDYGLRLLAECPDALSFGSSELAEIRLRGSEVSMDKLAFEAEYRGAIISATVPFGGKFNVSNCLAVIGALIALGNDPSAAGATLASIRPAPGRFEAVRGEADFKVIVDYAHTPDALEKLLLSVRDLMPNRVITVFGCGGDRDRSKRPKMAAAASALSDIVYVTSDNPRTEEPIEIIHEILPGIKGGTECRVEVDRAAAIGAAIAEAQGGDVVVIAGKGHEDYQIIGKTKQPFDDRIIAAQAMTKRAACV